MGSRKINLSTVFGGQYVGVREESDGIWLVSFMNYDLGFFDHQQNRVEPVGKNPFALKL
jgi:putative transposase